MEDQERRKQRQQEKKRRQQAYEDNGRSCRNEIFGDEALTKQVGIRPPEIFSMGRELDANALCYTVQEFLQMFEGGGADDKKTVRKYTG